MAWWMARSKDWSSKGLARYSRGRGLLRSLARPRVVMGRDEDDGNRAPRCLQQILEVEAAQPAQVDVQHQAIGSRVVAEIEKLLCGGEGVDGKALGSQEPAHRSHDVLVVVDHTDPQFRDAHDLSRAIAAGAFARALSAGKLESARV